MRVALVCPYDWAAPGGVQVHVRELGARLRGRGHDVLVLAPARGNALLDRDARAGVRVVGWPIQIPYNGSTAPIDPGPWRLPAVRRALHEFDPSVVHVHEPLAPNTSMWATLAAEAPVVATFHSGADRSLLFDVAAPLLRRVAARIAVRIAVSERAASFARARVGGRLVVIPNGIDVAAFARAEPADLGPGRKLLFVGRLHERKGFPVALEAFERLAAPHPDVRLLVVGAGAKRGAVGGLAPEPRSRVRMLGAVPNDDLPSIYRGCDVFLAPSLGGESFGVILLEAMAAGRPIVASRIHGYDEVIDDGRTGLLVPPRDSRALAEAAGRLLDDPELTGALAAAAAERARRYDWQVVAAEVEEAYRTALGAQAASVP